MLITLVRIILILPRIVRAASSANHYLMGVKCIAMKICTMIAIVMICSAKSLAVISSLERCISRWLQCPDLRRSEKASRLLLTLNIRVSLRQRDKHTCMIISWGIPITQLLWGRGYVPLLRQISVIAFRLVLCSSEELYCFVSLWATDSIHSHSMPFSKGGTQLHLEAVMAHRLFPNMFPKTLDFYPASI